ncbi:diguanylate cyclase [Brevibacillus ruminantium]|uniref:Diguanylate cyclase n=1 Tax=Brevibacillus ruminantium TaxID=2950604 RepID=A0ABY4WCY0_9BACL|nr:diguanylate cyclase [Brevibacillus ruminantium]USG63782.1 diguanylate cyclase [Brevibacillus ruminantium]
MNETDYQQLAAIAFETTPNALLLTDAKGNILLVNQAFCELTGYAKEEIVGKNPRILSSGRHDPKFYKKMWAELTQKGNWQGEIWNRRKTGELFLEYITIRSVIDENGEVLFYSAAFIDYTEQKKYQEKITYHAYHDYLTGLPNRLLFQKRVEEQIERAKAENTRLAILFLDLDGFKYVNDTYGHEMGDRLIQAVAKRLHRHFFEHVTVSRMSGDEFNILLPNLISSAEAEEAAADIVRLLQKPFSIEGVKIQVSTSIGISVFPEDGEELKDLLARADYSMYQAKGRGLERYGKSL